MIDMGDYINHGLRDGVAREIEVSNAHALNDYLAATRKRVHALRAT